MIASMFSGSDALRPARWVLLAATLMLAACEQEPVAVSTGGSNGVQRLVEARAVRAEALVVETNHSGTLRARRLSRVFAQIEGRVMALPYYEGDRVEAGETVVRIDDALLRVELEKLAALRQQSQLDLERLTRLVDRRMVTEEDLARARTAAEVASAEERALRTRISYATIPAPFDGVVSERVVEPGDVVTENQHLLTIVDPESLITEVTVSELLLPHLRVGSTVVVRIDALGSTRHQGRVVRIHPTVDAMTRRGVVEVALDPVPAGARAGQFCRVTLRLRTDPKPLVPIEALQRDRQGEYLFVVGADDTVHRREVRTGLRLSQGVELLQGARPGERVVVKGFMGLADGHQVQVVAGGRT